MNKCMFGKRLLMVALLALPIGLFGCGNGKDGANGANGANGATGPAGPVTLTSESCVVCHAAGGVADVAVVHTNTVLPQLTVSNVSPVAGTAVNGDPTFVTTFTVSGPGLASYFPGDNTNIPTDSPNHLTYLRFSYASLVTPAPSTGDTPQWQTYTDDDSLASELSCNAPVGSGSSKTMTCTMTTDVPAAITLGGDTVTYDPTLRTRVLLGVAPIAGISSAVTAVKDFVPSGSALSASRDLVPETACDKCHSNLETFGIPLIKGGVLHGGSRYTVEACVVCHTANNTGGGTNTAYVFQTLIHQIHSKMTNGAVGGGTDWSAVTYPNNSVTGIPDCTKCHYTDTTASVQTSYPYSYGHDAANYMNYATAAACGTCHPNVLDANTNSGTAHPGGKQPDSTCIICHPASGTGIGKSVATAHNNVPVLVTTDPATGTTGVNEDTRAEFIVHTAVTPPANGTYYVAGETPVVTVTLTKANADGTDSGTPVASSVYTTPTTDSSSAKGVSGGGLSTAHLYVYGPRAKAVPVLTAGSTTDPALTDPTKPVHGVSVLLPSKDAGVTTSAAGYSYKLEAIPATMAAGTYMIQFQCADFGGPGSTNFVTNSNALVTMQIGTATPTLKVAGDGCLNCHGTNREHFLDSHGHNAPFDTDWCLACHDFAGNSGDPIANRVHALHDANSKGDLQNILEPTSLKDWSKVTYPQNISRCVTCHNSGNTSYLTNPYEMPCYGCHVTTTPSPVVSHFQQNGGPFGQQP